MPTYEDIANEIHAVLVKANMHPRKTERTELFKYAIGCACAGLNCEPIYCMDNVTTEPTDE